MSYKKSKMITNEITRAEEKDLQEILNLQYLAYQSEAELFGTQDIPPLKRNWMKSLTNTKRA